MPGRIVSRIQICAAIAKPACTLIIMRKLYKIASLRSVTALDKTERGIDFVIEWGLGMVLPIFVAGPLYCIVQVYRFAVYDGLGCADVAYSSILTLLLLVAWLVVLPLTSLLFYYRMSIHIPCTLHAPLTSPL